MLTREEDIDVHALARQGPEHLRDPGHLGRDRKTVRAYLNGGRIAGERAKPAWEDVFEPFAEYAAKQLGEDRHLLATALFDELVDLRLRRLLPVLDPAHPLSWAAPGL